MNNDIKKLTIKLDFGFKRDIIVGTLYWSKDLNTNVFEYHHRFHETGLEISPIDLPVSDSIYEAKRDNDTYYLPYVFADALPDKWGRNIQDLEFEKINILNPSSLQRLAFIGYNGLGALQFEPAQEFDNKQIITDVADLRKATQKIIEGDVGHVTKELLKIGGSAGGQRPKFLVDYNLQTKQLRYTRGSHEGMFIPVVLKVPQNEIDNPDRFQKAEYCYCQIAKMAGINIPDTYLIPDNNGYYAFAIERFDIKPSGEKLHMHTLSGFIGKKFSDRDTSYNDLMETIIEYCENEEDLVEAYRRLVFNVFANNQDDHGKNFSLLMNSKGEWSLSPAYDISHSPGAGQLMSINGKTQSITYNDLERFAKDYSIENYREIIVKNIDALNKWNDIANKVNVPEKLKNRISQDISININRIEKEMYRTIKGKSSSPEWFKYTFKGAKHATLSYGLKQDPDNAFRITKSDEMYKAWKKDSKTGEFKEVSNLKSKNLDAFKKVVEGVFTHELNKSKSPSKGLKL